MTGPSRKARAVAQSITNMTDALYPAEFERDVAALIQDAVAPVTRAAAKCAETMRMNCDRLPECDCMGPCGICPTCAESYYSRAMHAALDGWSQEGAGDVR